jgi:hypothetical protein
MPMQFPIISSPQPSQTSHSIVDVTTTTRCRSSTTITALEEEFGPYKLPKSGATASSSFYPLALWLLLNPFCFVSPGLLSKLQIPKLKKRTTQGPVPRSLSFYKGPWVILWDCEVDDVNFPQSESPVEDVGFPRGSFPDCHASGEQDSELDQDVATPTNCTGWSSDEELTPLFSSNFPRTPHPNTLRGEVHPDGELLGISAPSPIRSDTL